MVAVFIYDVLPVLDVLLARRLDLMESVPALYEPDGVRSDLVRLVAVGTYERLFQQLQGSEFLHAGDMMTRGADALALVIRARNSNSTSRGRN